MRSLVVAAGAAAVAAKTVPASTDTVTTRACQPPYDEAYVRSRGQSDQRAEG